MANKPVEKGKNCFIIAEAGVNHNGDIALARKLVDAAKEAGADAVKFQTYKTEELVTEEADQAEYQVENIGKSESQYAMLKRLELTEKDFKDLKDYCDERGIIFMSTPHTQSAVDMLEPLVPAYKIGSGDLNNTPLLRYAASKGKPLIISTGMSTLEEIQKAVAAIKEVNEDLVVLHCTTSYPCPYDQVNLAAMQTIKEATGCVIGYSDHTEGIDVSLMAAAEGAYVIEKHFTLDKNMPGPDHKASLEPDELKKLVDRIRAEDYPPVTQEVLGSEEKKPTAAESKIARVARKSVITQRDIPAGNVITHDDLVIKRPGTGIAPEEIEKIVGKKARQDIKKDTLLGWSHIK
ncbi:N-acetylneuraminate synthase [Candidatus Woesearchaeota archaeon]|nr:N-acetylneuraminate synthase [Candidatus Woesearchaeota archaeon]